MKKVKNQKGFTLAELLIVVAVIAVLVAVAIPAFGNQLEKSRQSVDVSALRGALAVARVAEMNEGVETDSGFVKFGSETLAGAGENDDNYDSKINGIAGLEAAEDPVKIVQFWYQPDKGALTLATSEQKASDAEPASTKLGKATSSKLYADVSNLTDNGDSDVVKYDADTTLKATEEDDSKDGTVTKGLLVTFELSKSGVFKLVEVTYREKAYAMS